MIELASQAKKWKNLHINIDFQTLAYDFGDKKIGVTVFLPAAVLLIICDVCGSLRRDF